MLVVQREQPPALGHVVRLARPHAELGVQTRLLVQRALARELEQLPLEAEVRVRDPPRLQHTAPE